MLELDGVVGLVVVALWIFCFFDVVTTDESVMRNLPKMAWVFIVLLFPLLGSLVWLVAGRPQGSSTSSMPYRGNHGAPAFPEYDRPGRFAATSPEDDAEFLRGVRERAEEQRRQYRERMKREAEGDASQ